MRKRERKERKRNPRVRAEQEEMWEDAREECEKPEERAGKPNHPLM
jgi:hypothetical protein